MFETLIERLVRYAKIDTQSDVESSATLLLRANGTY